MLVFDGYCVVGLLTRSGMMSVNALAINQSHGFLILNDSRVLSDGFCMVLFGVIQSKNRSDLEKMQKVKLILNK